jgi:UDP-2-acetamido-3-amino-2,3-dideoxy-glucuronate N-acetyltransferase
MLDRSFYVHPTAEVEDGAQIGAGTRIWRQAQVRTHASVGEQCNIGKGVYIDADVRIGSRVKIQNVCFTNDLFPRAITPDGKLKSADDWVVTPTHVRYGASIGANSVIVCGVTVGEFALVGAGSVVTHDVPPHALVFGNPARAHGYVCRCAHGLSDVHEVQDGALEGWCECCQQVCHIPPAAKP